MDCHWKMVMELGDVMETVTLKRRDCVECQWPQSVLYRVIGEKGMETSLAGSVASED